MTPAAIHYVTRRAAWETSRRLGTSVDALEAELAALWSALSEEERATVPDGQALLWTRSQRWATIDSLPPLGR
jgi:hypothetical protein